MAGRSRLSLNIADGDERGRDDTRVSFLFLLLKVRAGGPRPRGGAGSGVQDAGVLGDRLVQVGGGDRQGDMQPFQVVPVRAQAGAGILSGRLASQGAGHRGRAAKQVSDLLSVQGVERDAPGAGPAAWYRHRAPPVAHMRSANRSGQAATISPQASCQPWVTCPSISRGAPSRSALGLPGLLRALPGPLFLDVEDSQPQCLGDRVIVRELGARFQDFPHFPEGYSFIITV